MTTPRPRSPLLTVHYLWDLDSTDLHSCRIQPIVRRIRHLTGEHFGRLAEKGFSVYCNVRALGCRSVNALSDLPNVDVVHVCQSTTDTRPKAGVTSRVSQKLQQKLHQIDVDYQSERGVVVLVTGSIDCVSFLPNMIRSGWKVALFHQNGICRDFADILDYSYSFDEAVKYANLNDSEKSACVDDGDWCYAMITDLPPTEPNVVLENVLRSVDDQRGTVLYYSYETDELIVKYACADHQNRGATVLLISKRLRSIIDGGVKVYAINDPTDGLRTLAIRTEPQGVTQDTRRTPSSGIDSWMPTNDSISSNMAEQHSPSDGNVSLVHQPIYANHTQPMGASGLAAPQHYYAAAYEPQSTVYYSQVGQPPPQSLSGYLYYPQFSVPPPNIATATHYYHPNQAQPTVVQQQPTVVQQPPTVVQQQLPPPSQDGDAAYATSPGGGTVCDGPQHYIHYPVRDDSGAGQTRYQTEAQNGASGDVTECNEALPESTVEYQHDFYQQLDEQQREASAEQDQNKSASVATPTAECDVTSRYSNDDGISQVVDVASDDTDDTVDVKCGEQDPSFVKMSSSDCDANDVAANENTGRHEDSLHVIEKRNDHKDDTVDEKYEGQDLNYTNMSLSHCDANELAANENIQHPENSSHGTEEHNDGIRDVEIPECIQFKTSIQQENNKNLKQQSEDCNGAPEGNTTSAYLSTSDGLSRDNGEECPNSSQNHNFSGEEEDQCQDSSGSLRDYEQVSPNSSSTDGSLVVICGPVSPLRHESEGTSTNAAGRSILESIAKAMPPPSKGNASEGEPSAINQAPARDENTEPADHHVSDGAICYPLRSKEQSEELHQTSPQESAPADWATVIKRGHSSRQKRAEVAEVETNAPKRMVAIAKKDYTLQEQLQLQQALQYGFRKPAMQCFHWDNAAHLSRHGTLCRFWHPTELCSFYPKCTLGAYRCGFAHPFCGETCVCEASNVSDLDPQKNHRRHSKDVPAPSKTRPAFPAILRPKAENYNGHK